MNTETSQDIRDALWPEGTNPTRVITCRSCGRKNRVSVPDAVFAPATCLCGSCGGALFLRPDEPLTGLASSAYEHSLDRKSLEALRAVPGFPALVRWMLANAGDRSMRILFMSSGVRCGPTQFPELVHLLDEARTQLDFRPRPQLFMGESPFLNAMTAGVEAPVIVVHSALLDALNDEEIVAVLGHELGHLHANHQLYYAMAQLLLMGGSLFFTALRLFTWPIQKALLQWMRCAELTADRAGLLACRDLTTALRVDMKLAGGHRPGMLMRTNMRIVPFLEQARDLARMETDSWLDSFVALLLTMDRTHPFAAWRVMHLVEWVEHGNYLDILAGHYDRTLEPKEEATGSCSPDPA